MQCDHFDAHRCRSCTLMGVPYAVQLADKDAQARRRLADTVPEAAWQAPMSSAESGFRNRAKLVVAGSPGAATLGILGEHRRGVDLIDCALYESAIVDALPILADFIDDLRLLPYDVAKARGELKHLHVTASPAGELMARFVVRSDRQTNRIRGVLPQLLDELPALRVVTLNHLPEHVALLEGEREEVLTPSATLPMDLGRVTLDLGPRSFFQTNTAVAVGLYEQARDWIGERHPPRLADLYCGIGGFALFAATLPTPPSVVGVEVSEDAVASARHTWTVLRDKGMATGDARFTVGDAASAAVDADCVIVNPPRRGIGPELAASIESSRAQTLIYSSCNPTTLDSDLALLPSFAVDRARLFDMFPQTGHSEVLIRAIRG